MKTPITDRVLQNQSREYDWQDSDQNRSEVENLARRLEQDRAALMEALEAAANFIEPDWRRVSAEMRKVVETARANFPNED